MNKEKIVYKAIKANDLKQLLISLTNKNISKENIVTIDVKNYIVIYTEVITKD